MSVILKALKKQKEEKSEADNLEEKAKPINYSEDEGFYRGKNSYIKGGTFFGRKIDFNSKSFWIGIGISLLIIILILFFIFWALGDKKTKQRPAGTAPKIEVKVPKKEAKTPVNVSALAAKARQEFDVGNLDKSTQLFRKAIEANPDNPMLYNGLGLVFVKKELYSSAEDKFQMALELDDECAECYNNLGYLKTLLNEPIEAKKYLEKAISLSNEYPDPYFNLGVLYEKEGDLATAVKYYKEFVELYPGKESEIVYNVTNRIRQLSGE